MVMWQDSFYRKGVKLKYIMKGRNLLLSKCVQSTFLSHDLNQEALNTWRWRLQHFLQLLSNWKFQKIRVILFVHLQKSNSFGRKSFLNQVMDTKFGGKLKTHKYINWWKFGVDISNHFWVIQNQPKFIVPCRQPVGHFRPPEVQNDQLVVYRDQ